jgi:hypothetical protein
MFDMNRFKEGDRVEILPKLAREYEKGKVFDVIKVEGDLVYINYSGEGEQIEMWKSRLNLQRVW